MALVVLALLAVGLGVHGEDETRASMRGPAARERECRGSLDRGLIEEREIHTQREDECHTRGAFE